MTTWLRWAQMTFNTLTKAVPVQYNELLNVYYNENQGITYALTFNYLQTLGYTNFDLVYDNGDTTIYGRPATTWGIGSYRTTTSDKDSGSRYDEALDANGGLISSNVQILSRDEIITIANEPTYTYTDVTSQEDIYDDLGAVICNGDRDNDNDYTWTVYTNGEEVFTGEDNDDSNNDNNYVVEDVDVDYRATGDGVQTEIYVDDADKTVTVVEINYYLGQVASVDEEEGTVSIRTVSDLKADGAKLDDRDFATTAFEDDDYVVFTIDQNDDDDFYICEMVAPETVDGTVTRVNKNVGDSDAYLYLDRETKYDYSDHMAYDLNNEGTPRHPELEEDYTLFLDPNGYVLAYSGDTTQRFLYVEDSDEELVNWEAAAILSDGTNDAISVDTDIKGIPGDDDIYYMKNEAIESKFDLGKWNSKVWLDSRELGNLDYVGTKISNIDYEIFEYDTNDDGDVYTLTARDTRYATGVDINNGKAYIRDEEGTSNITIDNSTIFVNVDNNTVYTGYDEVPDVSNAKIAYVLENDNSRDVAEIVYIIEGDIYDADAIFFVLTSTKKDSEKYDGDNYWQFDDMYVDGRHRTDLYVSYDALNDGDQLKAGVVYKVLKSIDGTYITEIEPVTNWDPAAVATGSALDVMDGNFWLWWVDNWNWARYTTRDTTYVVVEEEYNNNHTRLTGWDVSVGDDSDIIEWVNGKWTEDDDGYMTLVSVVKSDDNDAQLVYIWKFDPDYRTRDITVTLDGDVIDTQNVWWSDTSISGSDTEVGALDNQGYTFDSNIGTVVVNGNNWTISSIPAGYDDITINITSSSVDVLTKGNLTLNTLDAEYQDDPDNVSATNIWLGESNRIYYSFTIEGLSDLENPSVTWTETIEADGNVPTIVNKDKTSYEIVGNYVYASTTPNPDFNTNSVVTIYVSDLVVTEDVPEEGAITEVILDEDGNITFNDGADTSKTYSAELYQYAELTGSYGRVWQGSYKYGDTTLDIPKDWIDDAGSYYVVIDGVQSNVVRIAGV